MPAIAEGRGWPKHCRPERGIATNNWLSLFGVYDTTPPPGGIYFADSDGNEHEVYDEEPDARWREGRWQGVFPRQLEEVTA
jgi:hypothetical protein